MEIGLEENRPPCPPRLVRRGVKVQQRVIIVSDERHESQFRPKEFCRPDYCFCADGFCRVPFTQGVALGYYILAFQAGKTLSVRLFVNYFLMKFRWRLKGRKHQNFGVLGWIIT